MKPHYDISIVFPTLEESQNPFFLESLNALKEYRKEGNIKVEVIVSDGGNQLQKIIESDYPFIKYIASHSSSRSLRLKDGFINSHSNLIILHHPRSKIDLKALEFLLNNENKITWGGLTHTFDWSKPLLKFTSWYSNHVRLKLRGIIYLDHCFIINRSKLSDENIFPKDEIFEDTIISQNLLKQLNLPELFPFLSTTSSVRFKRNGLYRQILLNQILKVLFLLGLSDKRMNKLYEKGLELNSKFSNN
tara:strand:- start:148304 stop:149044 length:741 start_codon:yes stop_codon:yes gene_type:complete